ncbi:MAG: NAD-dependent epimerase/dehydratase family protein [Planctomycetales bacterium]|nr:NAD-dependent epimerase/dehydratase family protein [Planctomycetales bacterium]
MKVLVTGSSGLIGSAAVRHWDHLGADVVGIDNNMRETFFGPGGSTLWNLERLIAQTTRFEHQDLDIRNREAIDALFRAHEFELIIHCAAQPSHDKAKEIPLVDFDVNAGGTINLLEAARRYAPKSVFCHMSTNKVYGDAPNEIPLVELETRWDYRDSVDYQGITEECRIDRTTHSLFGASKLAADVIAQEFGRYFGMNVGVFRGGCLTGADHSGVELHGFLSYLVHVSVTGKPYTIFGYGGKQVRDQIDSSDVVTAFEAFAASPRPGEVYNLGGGRENAASVLECIQLIEEMSAYRVRHTYSETNRVGDHICYISNVSKFKQHYPNWTVRHNLRDILAGMFEQEERKHRLR